MKNKKGIHHVEYVIAVSVFLVALMFILYFMNFTSKAVGTSDLNSFEKIFREKTEIDVTEVILTTGGGSCPNVSLNSNLLPYSDKLIVRDKNGVVNFSLTSSDLSIDSISDYYEIFSSSSFDSHFSYGGSCSATGQYSLPFIEKFIFSQKLQDLETNYSTDYNKLKTEFGLNKDFSITITGDGISFNMIRNIPANIPVQAKEFRIKVIDENANIYDAVVNLRVW